MLKAVPQDTVECMSEDGEILGDHRWQRTTLIPPFIDSFDETLEFVRWNSEMVPELLWVGLLLDELGPHRTADIIKACANEAQKQFSNGGYVLSNDYDKLSQSDFEKLREELDDDIIEDIEQVLGPVAAHYPSIPQANLLEGVTEEDEEDILTWIMGVVSEISMRRSELGMYAQGIYVGTMFETGKLKLASSVDFGDINEVFEYPDTSESKRVASSVRATVSAMWGINSSERDLSDWATRFWERGFDITECIFPHELEEDQDQTSIEEPDEEFFENLAAIGFEYEKELKHKIIELWVEAPKDPKFTGKNEVLDGLLMRQVNFATNLATSPSMWSADSSGIILRCMTETQITLEWLNQNGEEEDYKQFIEYGLGQEKLVQEHYKKLTSTKDDISEELESGLKSMEELLEAQRYKHLIPVDVGHWADKNTRELAEEADCKDLYDLRFQQHNPAVHGSWDFLDKYNLVKCQNPLHQFHQVPQFQPLPKIPFVVVEAGNLMNRSLESWIEARGAEQDFELLDLSESVRNFLDESEYFDDMPF